VYRDINTFQDDTRGELRVEVVNKRREEILVRVKDG
jgi:hypothetical protein